MQIVNLGGSLPLLENAVQNYQYQEEPAVVQALKQGVP